MRMRRGTTLAELIVVLVLGSVILGLVTQSLKAHRRSERTIARSSQSASIADETLGVLTSALERVSSADTVLLRGDTAIELGFTIGLGLACAVGGDSVVFQENGTGWWESPPDSSDTIDAMTAGQWWRSKIMWTRSRAVASGVCAGLQRVVKIRPPPPSGPELPLVRVTRRTRFMIYRGGDGEWWFGERTCSSSPPYPCAAAQPVSGPLVGVRALQFAIDTTGSTTIVTVSATAGKTTRVAVLPLRP